MDDIIQDRSSPTVQEPRRSMRHNAAYRDESHSRGPNFELVHAQPEVDLDCCSPCWIRHRRRGVVAAIPRSAAQSSSRPRATSRSSAPPQRNATNRALVPRRVEISSWAVAVHARDRSRRFSSHKVRCSVTAASCLGLSLVSPVNVHVDPNTRARSYASTKCVPHGGRDSRNRGSTRCASKPRIGLRTIDSAVC
jgi:hypothetical protein